MQQEEKSIQLKLQEHDLRLNAVDKIMTESVSEQKHLVRELHELTSSFKVYIERHDQVNESSRRLWSMVERQQEEINTLKEFAQSSTPLIEGLKTLNGKLVWLVVAAMATPAVGAAYLVMKSQG